MALLAPSEKTILFKRGLYVRYKCDVCGRPIMSSLSYHGPNGEDLCSIVCRSQIADSNGRPRKVKEDMSDQDVDQVVVEEAPAAEAPAKKKKKVTEDEPKKKAKKAEPVAEEPKKKKAKAAAEEEAPAKKKKAKVVEVEEEEEEAEEEAPKSKKKDKGGKDKKKAKPEKAAKSGSNPYNRVGSAAYEVFEMAKAGTTRKAIDKYCADKEIASGRLYKELKSGDFRGMRWKYNEDEDGNISVKVRKAEKSE